MRFNDQTEYFNAIGLNGLSLTDVEHLRIPPSALAKWGKQTDFAAIVTRVRLFSKKLEEAGIPHYLRPPGFYNSGIYFCNEHDLVIGMLHVL